MKNQSVTQFYIGLVLALGSAFWTIWGTFHPAHIVILILGIIFISTSKYRLIR